MIARREQWRARLATLITEIQPELGPVELTDDVRLGEDLGLDSFALEELFTRLKAELPAPLPVIGWLNALEAESGRAGTLLDLILLHELQPGEVGRPGG